MELELTSAQRRALRARAHGLNPVVMIGNASLTTVVLNEIRNNLNNHELIKIRVFSDEYATRDRWLNEICTTLHAAPVQHIGKILVIYRPVPAEVKARKNKAAAKRKPARRAKRSYQRER